MKYLGKIRSQHVFGAFDKLLVLEVARVNGREPECVGLHHPAAQTAFQPSYGHTLLLPLSSSAVPHCVLVVTS
jgi:hypothetical protein